MRLTRRFDEATESLVVDVSRSEFAANVRNTAITTDELGNRNGFLFRVARDLAYVVDVNVTGLAEALKHKTGFSFIGCIDQRRHSGLVLHSNGSLRAHSLTISAFPIKTLCCAGILERLFNLVAHDLSDLYARRRSVAADSSNPFCRAGIGSFHAIVDRVGKELLAHLCGDLKRLRRPRFLEFVYDARESKQRLPSLFGQFRAEVRIQRAKRGFEL